MYYVLLGALYLNLLFLVLLNRKLAWVRTQLICGRSADPSNRWFLGWWFLGSEIDSPGGTPSETESLLPKGGTNVAMEAMGGSAANYNSTDNSTDKKAVALETAGALVRPKPKYIGEYEVAQRSELGKWLLGDPPNAHEALFWFDRQGPGFLHWYVRVCLILMSIYIPSIVYVLAGDLSMVKSNELNIGIFVLKTLLAFGGWVACYFKLVEVVCRGEVKSVEMMRKRDMINKVKVDQLAAKVLNLFGVINKLRFTAQIQHDKEEIDNMAHLSNGHVDTSGMDRKVKRHIEDIFRAYDADNSGALDQDEVLQLLHSLGQDADPDKAGALCKSLSVDGDGLISLDEFTEWMYLQQVHKDSEELPDADSASMEEVAQGIFNLFDVNKDGSCHVSEFETRLRELGLNLNTDEINALVNQLDANLDGEITVSEFVTMIEDNGFQN